MNKYSTAFVLIFVALVHGHGWLNSPQPGGFAGVKNQAGASQSSPCGLGVDPEIPPTIVTNYGELNISYTIGGGHDGSTPSSCRFSIARQMNNTQFEQNVVYTISPCTEGEFNKTITASFPDLTAPETFYFQFFWQAGDGGKWYGCARVGLNPASVVINDFSVGTPVTGNIDGPETIYYKTTASTSKNVYVKASGAERGDVMVYGKSGSAASTSSYDFTANLTAGESVGFSLCGSPTVDQDVYINYVGADNNTSGDFSFVTSEYTSEIIFSNPTPQISDSISGPGSKFYYTAAYTTSEKPKIVVVSTQGTVSVKQTIGVTCTTSRTFDATGSGNVCFKLSDNKNTKTIQVYSMGTASYTVSVQNGDCAELEQGSNSFRIQFSVALLVVSVILSLFL